MYTVSSLTVLLGYIVRTQAFGVDDLRNGAVSHSQVRASEPLHGVEEADAGCIGGALYILTKK